MGSRMSDEAFLRFWNREQARAEERKEISHIAEVFEEADAVWEHAVRLLHAIVDENEKSGGGKIENHIWQEAMELSAVMVAITNQKKKRANG